MKNGAMAILFVFIGQTTLLSSGAFAQMGPSDQGLGVAAKPTIVVRGAKAKELLQAVLGSNEDVVDFCTAHTCHLTTKCAFDQSSAEKLVCTIEQTESL